MCKTADLHESHLSIGAATGTVPFGDHVLGSLPITREEPTDKRDSRTTRYLNI